MELTKSRVVRLSLLIFGFIQPVTAQSAAHTSVSTRDGVYSEEQAQLGRALYKNQCALCHGDALEGQGQNAPLIGGQFLDKWSDQTVADLFMKTITTMPMTGPGSMTPQDTARVLSYVLSVNKLRPGKKDLPTDPQVLETIHIVKP